MGMQVRGYVQEPRRFLVGLEGRAVPKAAAASRSLKHTAGRVNTIARRTIAKQIGFKQKEIMKKGSPISRLSQGGTTG